MPTTPRSSGGDAAAGRWWLTADDARRPVDRGEKPLSLAGWLISQLGPQLLNELSLDERFAGPLPYALLSQPIFAGNGGLLAVLIRLQRPNRDALRRVKLQRWPSWPVLPATRSARLAQAQPGNASRAAWRNAWHQSEAPRAS